MIAGYDIIYYSPGPWDDLWRNRQQLMSLLAEQNRVVFVENLRTLRQVLTNVLSTPRNRQFHHTHTIPGLRTVSRNLFVFRYPAYTPATRLPVLRRVFARIRTTIFRSVLRRLCITHPIVWYSLPSMVHILNDVPSPLLRIYHVVDEYSAYSATTPDRRIAIQSLESRLLRAVDLVITVSEKLRDSKKVWNPSTFVVPNASNFALFRRALHNPCLPTDLQAIPRPRLGYVGLISGKLDLPLLLALADLEPSWSLVLVGHVRIESDASVWRNLISRPNVHVLNQVAVDRVPEYIKGLDVGLLPYRLTRFVEYCSPLKFYDYLAAGIPIVSVDIPSIQQYQGLYYCSSNDADSLRENIRKALSEDSPHLHDLRLKIASSNTWADRVESISTLLSAHLHDTPPPADRISRAQF